MPSSGTGTVFTDDPSLTARLPNGTLAPSSPLCVVVGQREIPPNSLSSARIRPPCYWWTRDPLGGAAGRWPTVPTCWLEGGPTLAGAFLRSRRGGPHPGPCAAPMLLGGPVTAVDDVGVAIIGSARAGVMMTVSADRPDLLLGPTPT